MELWIRSQSKIDLMCVKRVQYGHANNKHIIYGENLTMFLGEYATRERCLEIIDEIQELLKLGNPENSFMHINNCNMCYDDIQEMVKRARETKAVVIDGADFEIVMPRVVTYEMPEK